MIRFEAPMACYDVKVRSIIKHIFMLKWMVSI